MDPVRKAVWFVESHSRDHIALDDIAAACSVSAFHLTRSFAATMGLSLMRYVRGRRLSEAAKLLAGGADDILRLALDADYGSHEAFTRAFREQFGLTPEQVRAQGHVDNIQLVEAIPMNTASPIEIAAPRIVMSEPLELVGIVERYACPAKQGIPNQWQRFNEHFGHIPGQINKTAYGVCYNFDAESNFDYMCATEVRPGAELPEGFERLRVPAHRYAVFAHTGHIAGIEGTFAAIWGTWFPQSGHQAAEAPTLEVYGESFDPMTGLGGLEIWIAIQG